MPIQIQIIKTEIKILRLINQLIYTMKILQMNLDKELITQIILMIKEIIKEIKYFNLITVITI
jgi:hypothetical protein